MLFHSVCELLSQLDEVTSHDPPFSTPLRYNKQRHIVTQWFGDHGLSIENDVDELVALLSTIFPAKRTDRVYNLQRKALSNLVKRGLGLKVGRVALLDKWKVPGRGDLADCIERVMRQTDDSTLLAKQDITVQSVDDVLSSIASNVRFSCPKVRKRQDDTLPKDAQRLQELYRMLPSNDAKWLTKIILKDLTCLKLFDNIFYAAIDTRLPTFMRMYNDFQTAITELNSLLEPPMPYVPQHELHQQVLSERLRLVPRIGVKVGPTKWIKARGGVKHAVSLIDGRTMSIERKHDGEYCQVHIDLTNPEQCIKMFSKSCKDSTIDREGVHGAIKDGLRIGREDCRFSKQAILEGELLVWSDTTSDVLEFHKIRKHVSRSGSFLGTSKDSQPRAGESLMIIFYDVLLIDEFPVMHEPYLQRRQHLENLVTPLEGKTDVVWQTTVEFSSPDGPRQLKKFLAKAFVRRWEGLVLKPANEPYFDNGTSRKHNFPPRWLKLKKDCIKGLGDTADFAIVAAGYDARVAAQSSLTDLKWTHFYMACLMNKKDVKTQGEKPKLLVFDCVNDCIKTEDLKTINDIGPFRGTKPSARNGPATFDLEYCTYNPSLPDPDIIFHEPFVFDIAGSGFDKSPNQGIFTLRFPRVIKVHWDRDWRDAVDLDELQQMATLARTGPSGDLRDEVARWMQRLDMIDKGPGGKLTSWDYSDDEESDMTDNNISVAKEPAISKPTNSRTTRQSRDRMGPPLVRMDTQEMMPCELRLGNGDVVKSPAQKQAKTCNSIDDFCLESAVSSLAESTQNPRKRPVDEHGPMDNTFRNKRARRPSLPQSKSAPSMETDYKPPLQDVINSSRPAARHTGQQDTDTSVRTCKALSRDFGLVRKLEVDPLGRYKRPVGKRISEPVFSPSRETTISTQASVVTSQQTAADDTHPGLSEDSVAADTPLLTPPSSRVESQRDIKGIPDLSTCQIVLGRPLINSNPEQLARLVFDLPMAPMSLSQFMSSQKSHGTTSRDKSDLHILYLVDMNDETGETASDLLQLARQPPDWHLAPFHVWHWTIIERSGKDSSTPPKKATKELIESLRVARMTWTPRGSNAEDDGGTVLVEWADGRITERSFETPKQIG